MSDVPEFEHTVGEIQAIFESLVGTTGESSLAERMLRIPIDGVALRDRRAERHTSQSIFYHKIFLEANCVVYAFTQLNLDATIENVVRADKPDIEVHFGDRPSIFVEHRLVMQEGMPFDRHIEQGTIALRRLANQNVDLATFLDSGSLNIRVNDPGLSARAPHGSQLAIEALRLCAEIQGQVSLLKPESTRFPLLHRYNAQVFYRPGQRPGGLIFQRGAHAFDPNAQWLVAAFLKAMDDKKRAVTGYDTVKRPLWLVLSVLDDDLFAPFAREAVASALEAAGITSADAIAPFDRLIVHVPGMQPICMPE